MESTVGGVGGWSQQWVESVGGVNSRWSHPWVESTVGRVTVCVCRAKTLDCHRYRRQTQAVEPRAKAPHVLTVTNRMYLEEGKLEVPVQLYGITGENVIQTTLGREGGWEGRRVGRGVRGREGGTVLGH